MIPDEDRATEPEGFTEWMKEFQYNNLQIFGDKLTIGELEKTLIYPARKRPVKKQDIETLKYYICRACRDAQLNPEPETSYNEITEPKSGSIRFGKKQLDQIQKQYPKSIIQYGKLRFTRNKSIQRERPFQNIALVNLIFELALLVKTTLKRGDISLQSRPKRIPTNYNPHLEVRIPVRLNVLNQIIADLVTSTFELPFEYTKKEVKERLDAINKNKAGHYY